MKYIIHLIRLFVGVIFIISGLIKLNDPVGFSFKLDEYFSEPVLNLPFLMPFALSFAIIVCIAEVILGVMLLVGYQKKWTLWLLLAMLVFFGFLTFYSAYYNKVTDCGCFGDAIKFTPWQSFGKDILLLVLTLILFAGQKFIEPITKSRLPFAVTMVSLAGCLAFVYYVYNHLPVIDFRAYKIGTNIEQGMEIPEDAPKAEFAYHWKFSVNGKEKIITTSGDYPKSEGDFVSVDTEEIKKGYEPPIHDFTIEDDGEDFAYQFLNDDKVLMIISYRIDKSDKKAWASVKKTADKALQQGYKVIGMTSNPESADKIVKDNELNFKFYFTDETTLKTMIRSNPGYIILKKGTITDKKHFNDFDDLAL
ncbi:MAG: DoxX family protein [Capnocytophaga sp.]|nr:DoxX family protein [Capnocytophaga sp.]